MEWATLNDLRRRLFALIDATPHLNWLILTKRPQNIRRMWPKALHCSFADQKGHRHNVWLLTSVSDQATADALIPELLKCRDLVPVLGVSAEPLLGPIDFTRICIGHWAYGLVDVMSGYLCGDEPDEMYNSRGERRPVGKWKRGKVGLDWVIVGGESGPGHREMPLDAALSIVDQCTAAGIPVFVKQDSGPRPEQQGRLPASAWERKETVE